MKTIERAEAEIKYSEGTLTIDVETEIDIVPGLEGPGLAVGEGRGFLMRFDNGNTASIQFASSSDCDEPTRLTSGSGDDIHCASNAEIAAYDASGNWYEFRRGGSFQKSDKEIAESNKVCGRRSPQEVASFLFFVSRADLTNDRWEGRQGLGSGADFHLVEGLK